MQRPTQLQSHTALGTLPLQRVTTTKLARKAAHVAAVPAVVGWNMSCLPSQMQGDVDAHHRNANAPERAGSADDNVTLFDQTIKGLGIVDFCCQDGHILDSGTVCLCQIAAQLVQLLFRAAGHGPLNLILQQVYVCCPRMLR